MNPDCKLDTIERLFFFFSCSVVHFKTQVCFKSVF